MKNAIKCNLLVVMCLLVMLGNALPRDKKMEMRSNKKNIKMYFSDKSADWTITPELNPDIFKFYDRHAKSERVKFISDVDSIQFDVKLNKPFYFSILHKTDTAHICIELTNELPNTLSKADKQMALSLFWSETRYNFAFYDKLKFDWDSLYKAYIPIIDATTNDVDFYELMKRFAGRLNDAHSGVYYFDRSLYSDYIPFHCKFFGDSLRIISVRDNLKNIYPLGSKVLEINGLPVNEYMKTTIYPYLESDFEPTQKMLVQHRLFPSRELNNKIVFKYITPDGELRINTPPRDAVSNKSGYFGMSAMAESVEPVEITWTDNNIAVLSLNTFYERNEGDIIKHFEMIKDTIYNADGLIIDLRCNGGGDTGVAWHFIQYIVKDTFFLNIASQTRINEGSKKAQGNFIKEYKDYYNLNAYTTRPADTVFVDNSIKKFDMPIAVLISNKTCSAAEDFLIMLYERPDRPLFIGQPSFGSTGVPLVLWDWPDENNGFARICSRRVLFPYSMKPFDKGIEPDILVEYTFEEYMSGVDKDIEVAVTEILKHIRERGN